MKEKCVNEEIFCYDIDILLQGYKFKIQIWNVYIQHMDTKFKCEDM